MKKLQMLLALLCMTIGMAVAQVTKVTGVVVDADTDEPIIGASVLVKGTTIGTITDLDGKYEITNIPAGSKALQVSYVGMRTVEVPITTSAAQKIVMHPDAQVIDEVVVVAYGTAKKSSFTGSASTVGAQTLEKRSITNVTSALEGNTTGVQVTSATGQPGDAASIRVRGFGSVNASSAPLMVVDGAIYNGNMGDINPADIESMTILKDAASTSLYGSSAGNGVILITTKKGKGNGGTNFNLTINQGFSNIAYKDYAKQGMVDWFETQWEMRKNAIYNSYKSKGATMEDAAKIATMGGDNATYSYIPAKSPVASLGDLLVYNPFRGVANNAIVGTDGKINPAADMNNLKWGDDLDWEDEAYGTGHRQEYVLSYNTKTDKSDTYASAAYLNDMGYMKKTDFERYSARLNYNVYPVKWFKTGLNLALSRVQSMYSSSTSGSSSSYSNLTRFIRNMAPNYPIHKHDYETGEYLNADGKVVTDPSEYVYDYKGKRLADAGRDAFAETEFNSRERARNQQTANTYITILPIEGLNLTTNYSYSNVDLRSKTYENPWVGDGAPGARLSLTSTRGTTQTLNQLISYTRDFGKHTLDAMVGHENYSYKYEYFYSMKNQEIINGIKEFANFVNISSVSSYTDEYKKEGYFARLNYDYADKYYASMSYRHDGSSRFSKDNRWGNFWSFGASWRVSEEEFMKDVEWVNSLKIRASYGETGNDMILDSDGYASYYPYQSLYNLGTNNGNESGAYMFGIANPDLKWETQVSSDFGIEFGLFDKLTGSIEYFRKDSKNLLFDVAQATSTGVTSVIKNIGKVSNYGLEIELNYNVYKNKDWNVSVGANATFLKNELVELPEEMKENGYISGSKKWMEGKSMYEFWLRQWAGVDPKTGDGLWIPDTDNYDESNASYAKTLVEVDGKTYTNSYSYAKYDWSGTSTPDVFGGFNFKVGYKDFDLAATFSYQLGGKLIDAAYASMMSVSNHGYGQSPDLLKAWRKEGDVTDVPRLDNTSAHATNIGQTYSTRWLTSSDYLNLRSVSLGYSVPKDLLKKLGGLKSTRINVTAENLFMLKARQGLNPMSNFGGYTYNEYMPARTITIGLNVGF